MVLWWNKFIPQSVYFGHTNKIKKIKMYFCFWRVTKRTHRENERDRERQTETDRDRQTETERAVMVHNTGAQKRKEVLMLICISIHTYVDIM